MGGSEEQRGKAIQFWKNRYPVTWQTFCAFDTITEETVQGILTIPFANGLIQKIDGIAGTIENLSII